MIDFDLNEQLSMEYIVFFWNHSKPPFSNLYKLDKSSRVSTRFKGFRFFWRERVLCKIFEMACTCTKTIFV